MLKVLFTLDYEIHGNGDGCPMALMVEPTNRMMSLFERYGAKLTIMADVAEILKFKEYKEQFGRDDYHYDAIVEQLRDAIRRGHDVQLHIHASYFNARFEDGRWRQDWSEYDFAGLPADRITEVVRIGKQFLEGLLRPVNPDYGCVAFRAANWSVSPSKNVVRALLENGLKIDTSVFKYGYRQGLVSFDYTRACNALVPWKADEEDICIASATGRLYEFPIYAENRSALSFLTPQRVYRACVGRLHRFSTQGEGARANQQRGNEKPRAKGARQPHWLARKHAWKADFNQCSGRQLIRALERAHREHGHAKQDLPFVLIGHSKLFTRFNARSLRPFLARVQQRPAEFSFGRFGDFDLHSIVPVQQHTNALRRGKMAVAYE
jgi:hypothetical protein